MSAETETIIKRPQFFKECRTCPIATNKIIQALNLIPNFDYQSVETKFVLVRCRVEGSNVTLWNTSIHAVTMPDGSKKKMSSDEGAHRYAVNCPHFNHKSNKEKSDPE